MTIASPTAPDTETTPPAAKPAPGTGFDFGAICNWISEKCGPLISWLINLMQGILSGTGSFFSHLISTNAPATAEQQQTPPAAQPPLSHERAQDMISRQGDTMQMASAGDPRSLPNMRREGAMIR